jgi:hypothetical protein
MERCPARAKRPEGWQARGSLRAKPRVMLKEKPRVMLKEKPRVMLKEKPRVMLWIAETDRRVKRSVTGWEMRFPPA